jgi:hypothetical protein
MKIKPKILTSTFEILIMKDTEVTQETAHIREIFIKKIEWYDTNGKRIRDTVEAVRGTVYEVHPRMNLSPTSGTCQISFRV